MPEGDSVYGAARRMAAGLVGRTVTASDFRVPGADPERPLPFRDAVPGADRARETWWCPTCQPGAFPWTADRRPPSQPRA